MTIATLSSNDWLRREARLTEARAVIRAKPGTYSDLTVLAACATLMDDGDALDWRDAQLVRVAVLSQVEDDQPLTQQIAEALKARGPLGVIADVVGLAVIIGICLAIYNAPEIARALGW